MAKKNLYMLSTIQIILLNVFYSCTIGEPMDAEPTGAGTWQHYHSPPFVCQCCPFSPCFQPPLETSVTWAFIWARMCLFFSHSFSDLAALCVLNKPDIFPLFSIPVILFIMSWGRLAWREVCVLLNETEADEAAQKFILWFWSPQECFSSYL
jgi:hypothetical protein